MDSKDGEIERKSNDDVMKVHIKVGLLRVSRIREEESACGWQQRA